MEVVLKDTQSIKDVIVNDSATKIIRQMKGGVKKTKIFIVDHETGKLIDTVENKILVPGSQVTACKQFGIEQVVPFPTYNLEMGLDNSYGPYEEQPHNIPITCLWCVGQSGFANTPGEIIAVDTKDRIAPSNDILPFRYVSNTDDLDYDQRQTYFGRRTFVNGKIGYFFKKFDTEPMLHIRYLDGTEVGENMWEVETPQDVEVFVEMRLSVTRLDFRDYFDQVLGWENAYINTVSLCTAWYSTHVIEDDGTKYRWYQDIIPFRKFNFKNNDLTELNKAVDFIYQIYY